MPTDSYDFAVHFLDLAATPVTSNSTGPAAGYIISSPLPELNRGTCGRRAAGSSRGAGRSEVRGYAVSANPLEASGY
jgi:hypothetical protein